MDQLPKSVIKYLNKYTFGYWALESNRLGKIENVIVVPVIAEYEYLRVLFDSLLTNHNKYFSKTALIVVVNNLADSSSEVKTDNQKSLTFLRSIIQKSNLDDPLIQKAINSNLNICLIDASSPGLEMPNKIGGVGLARKIGMDAALNIFDYNSSRKKIIICLDADCTVDSNYLTTIVDEFNSKNSSAAIVKYEHNIEDNSLTAHAIICYEIFLRYYVLGLKYANSLFAFHTVGSTMICDYESYIKVEGMNKQKAAEDFYFIEKLAKNYKIEEIVSTTVYPSSRSSWRVPFGTGQRVGRFLSNTQNEYLLYNPKSFDILKEWLYIFNSDEAKTSQDFLNSAKNIHIELFNFLMQQNFGSDWSGILENSTSSLQISKQKLKWFDGFRTLKFIHHLRDTAFPQVDMFVALNEMFTRVGIKRDFFWYRKDLPAIDTQKQYLELMREIT
ncbi:MAG: hypothetical protein HXY50_02040 [Ignavibacteriaceae bacterium]|nr:hypothetical protein [Ignavibacteriaceae bacterium]